MTALPYALRFMRGRIAIVVGLVVAAVLLVPSAASAKPHLDWCAVATFESQRADDVNHRRADVEAAIDERLAQLQSGGEGVSASIVQAQIRSLQNQNRLLDERQVALDAVVANTRANCDDQLTQAIPCFRKWGLTKAQRRDLAADLATVDPSSPYVARPPVIRCPFVRPDR